MAAAEREEEKERTQRPVTSIVPVWAMAQAPDRVGSVRDPSPQRNGRNDSFAAPVERDDRQRQPVLALRSLAAALLRIPRDRVEIRPRTAPDCRNRPAAVLDDQSRCS